MVDNGPQAPEIAPAKLNLMGESIEICADVDPAQFPNGMELLIGRPGAVELLGKILVAPGRMVAVIPLEMANQLRAMIQKSRTLHPGQVDSPGVKT